MSEPWWIRNGILLYLLIMAALYSLFVAAVVLF